MFRRWPSAMSPAYSRPSTSAFGLGAVVALTLAFGVLGINRAAGVRVDALADIPSRAGHSKGLGTVVSVGGIALTLIYRALP